MKIGDKNITRRDIIKMEDDQVVVANRLRADKERVAQAAVLAGTAGICMMWAANKTRNSDPEGYLSNVSSGAGMMCVGAVSAISIAALEGMRCERLQQKAAIQANTGTAAPSAPVKVHEEPQSLRDEMSAFDAMPNPLEEGQRNVDSAM